MFNNNSFTLASLLYGILLITVYFSKKRIHTKETQIYGYLIISALGAIIFATLTAITMQYSDKIPIITLVCSKGLLVAYAFWILLFTHYIIVITLNNGNNKRYKTLLYIAIYLSVFVIFLLPLYYHTEDNIVYSYGPSANFVYVLVGIAIILWLIILGTHIKKIRNKKYYPVVFFIILLTAAIIIQKLNPGLLLITYTETFITFLMYFTIENPDIKMINELEFAKNQAEKANRAKTDFLSSMSHEIRTPLNAIVGLSDVIKNSNDLDEIHEDAADVVSASNTLLEIVNGILDISRIEADKMEIVETNYNPIDEFSSLVKLTETRIGEKEIELRSDFAVDLPDTLYGDKGKIKQIITNLLSNAVKYTEKGYIDFKVSCINEKDNCKLTIKVQDTGRGIKKEQMDNLFTKFNRLDSDKNTTIEGTGLGLAITKALVEMMGGKIVVDSTYGKGSKFTVFISQKISDKLIDDNDEEEIKTFEGKKILIVDDNKLNIKVASKILKEFKVEAYECYSGFACLDKIKNNEKYDLILMDIMMPKMSGVEVLKKLRAMNNFNTPVVALTADVIKGQSNKYLEVGFNDYIPKPIDKYMLNNVLNKIFNNKITEEEIKEEEPDIHTVIPVTEEDFKELSELLDKK